jgi:hypothetical protein
MPGSPSVAWAFWGWIFFMPNEIVAHSPSDLCRKQGDSMGNKQQPTIAVGVADNEEAAPGFISNAE